MIRPEPRLAKVIDFRRWQEEKARQAEPAAPAPAPPPPPERPRGAWARLLAALRRWLGWGAAEAPRPIRKDPKDGKDLQDRGSGPG